MGFTSISNFLSGDKSSEVEKPVAVEQVAKPEKVKLNAGTALICKMLGVDEEFMSRIGPEVIKGVVASEQRLTAIELSVAEMREQLTRMESMLKYLLPIPASQLLAAVSNVEEKSHVTE